MAAPEEAPVVEVTGEEEARNEEVSESIDASNVLSEDDIERITSMRGQFKSLTVLVEQLPLFDLKVVTTNPLRIWKNETGDLQSGWKPDATQLSAGAKLKISDVVRVQGVNGKGWNENSEYYLGCVGENRWCRLINFRGVATTVPDMKCFKERVGGVIDKITEMQALTNAEQERRIAAEERCLAAEDRVQETEKARQLADNNLAEMEKQFQDAQELAEQKLELNNREVELAKREATEAVVLMKYFERRMVESATISRVSEKTTAATEETIRKIQVQLQSVETRERELRSQLEESERSRAELETLLGQIDQKQLKASSKSKSGGAEIEDSVDASLNEKPRESKRTGKNAPRSSTRRKKKTKA